MKTLVISKCVGFFKSISYFSFYTTENDINISELMSNPVEKNDTIMKNDNIYNETLFCNKIFTRLCVIFDKNR